MNVYTAVEEEDVEKLKKYIKLGLSVNLADENGVLPIFTAVQKDNEEIVDILIKNKAKINARHVDDDTTPIMHCSSGKMVKKLIESGAHINSLDMTGWSALHYAVSSSRLEVVEELVKVMNVKNINMGNSNGVTPLILSARVGDIKIVQILMKNGAALKDKEQIKYAIFDAKRYKNMHIAEYLIKVSNTLDNLMKLEAIKKPFSKDIYRHIVTEVSKYNRDDYGI